MGNETCWLWAQNQFVAPQDLVLEYPNNLDLSSYIGKVPSEFLPYRTLFQRFGLRKVLSNEDILGILYSIQQTIEARQPPFASSSEVKVSIEILNWLWKEKKTVQDDIPVPVIAEGGKFTLKPRSTALFCDVSKNGLKELNCREEEIYVIHEEIPKAAAEWLEIRFLSTHILDPEEIGIEQCGQSEPITMRIKNILKEYDEDSDIFKELIQNAEDAGADVCKFLVDFRGYFEAKVKITDDCLIPNEHGVLQFASELFYNDSPWMPLTSGVTLCHENIPRAMARHLGIKTTRHHTLENHIVDDMSPFAFDFEQQEQLTVRIKNIISAYPSKKDILKELIQNADDAEATEIHFIWDKRQHGKEKTFGKKWNNLQGPALCVFNNKVFSDADIKGIQQLGEGGKHRTPGKIGKYGVGFNSVYHLTDCPSILTGDEVLCISDPNQKYIENHSNNQRYGIGYKLADTFKEMYVDVYKSFLPDKFSLKDGTMFRLPLRMGTNANTSKISQQGVTDRDMKELCSALSEDPEGLILFLKNICKIKVHEISEDSGGLKTIFEVEKHLPQRSRDEKDTFVKHLQNALQSDKTVTPHKTFYETVISTSDKRQSKWIVAEQFGSFKDSFELKLSDKIPQASLAARVNTKGSSIMDFKGEAFCSLPLPGKTGLPVHVNGNFEVDSARTSLWKEDGKSKKSGWNEILKQHVIAPLYADLLHYIRRSIAVKKVFSKMFTQTGMK
uniref:sacsin n=1 Tax=Maylandia zebra TaxID=106582 RepID=UPI000D319316|nr:sacsin-like [Maylandia zebra]